MEKVVVSGVSLNENEAKISIIGVPDVPGIAAQIFEKIALENISVDMIIQNVSEQGLSDISFTVHKNDTKKAITVGEGIRKSLKAKEIRADGNIAKISAVGVGMRSHSGVAAKMFKALADNGINIDMISTSEIKISCVVGAERGRDALRVIHKAFDLDKVVALVEE